MTALIFDIGNSAEYFESAIIIKNKPCIDWENIRMWMKMNIFTYWPYYIGWGYVTGVCICWG